MFKKSKSKAAINLFKKQTIKGIKVILLALSFSFWTLKGRAQ